MSDIIPSGELLNLTEAMLGSAVEGKWSEVEELERKRQIVLKRLNAVLTTPLNGAPIDIIDKHMREVLSLNVLMTDLAESAKLELADALGGLSQGRKAVKAYYGMK